MTNPLEVDVMFSGGLDSLACAIFYQTAGYRVRALFVDYGQVAFEREAAAARCLTERLGLPLVHATIRGLTIPEGNIPGRNALLLTIGLMQRCRTHGLVAIGIHSGTVHSDCTAPFIAQMQSLFDLYSAGSIRVAAPFIEWTKLDIWQFLARYRALTALTYSCERGLPQPCGGCLSCADLEVLYAR